MAGSEKIETSIAFLEIKNDILYIVLKKDADVDLEAVKESFEARKKIQGNKKMLVLVDNRKIWQLTEEANKFSASKEVAEMSKAMAILTVSSIPTILITNFFIKFNKQYSPTKMFKSEKRALAWLETHR